MRALRILVVTTAILLLGATQARAQEDIGRPFGIGLMLGSPTGLSAKYYMGGPMALQMGLGVVERWGDDGFHVFADAVFHPAVLARTRSFTLPFYLGIGGRLLHHDGEYWENGAWRYDDDDTHLGVRAPIGLLMDFNRVPFDLFFELAFVVDVIHITDEDRAHHDHDLLDLYGSFPRRSSLRWPASSSRGGSQTRSPRTCRSSSTPSSGYSRSRTCAAASSTSSR